MQFVLWWGFACVLVCFSSFWFVEVCFFLVFFNMLPDMSLNHDILGLQGLAPTHAVDAHFLHRVLLLLQYGFLLA